MDFKNISLMFYFQGSQYPYHIYDTIMFSLEVTQRASINF